MHLSQDWIALSDGVGGKGCVKGSYENLDFHYRAVEVAGTSESKSSLI